MCGYKSLMRVFFFFLRCKRSLYHGKESGRFEKLHFPLSNLLIVIMYVLFYVLVMSIIITKDTNK